jgi:TrmH family RNA methyltransferase
MGAIFAVAIARVSDVSELPGERCALVADAGEPIWRVGESILGGVRESIVEGMPRARAHARTHTGTRGVPPNARRPSGLTLLVGAEREGLPEELVASCERVAYIPIASESLNAAMAATVALYEVTRPSTRVPAS